MSYLYLLWLQKRLTQSRRFASSLGEDELAKTLDSYLSQIEDLERGAISLAAPELDGLASSVEETCNQVDARLEAEARAALLGSPNTPHPSRCRPEDVLEEAILNRERAGLAKDSEQQRIFGKRALELARLAHELSMAQPVKLDAEAHAEQSLPVCE